MKGSIAIWRIAKSLGLTVLLVFVGCAKAKEATHDAAQSPLEKKERICAALAVPSPLEVRFAGLLPLEAGGALCVLGNVTEADFNRVFTPLGVRDVDITTCGTELVVFVPGATDSWDEVLPSALPQVRIKEKATIMQRRAPPKKRATRD